MLALALALLSPIAVVTLAGSSQAAEDPVAPDGEGWATSPRLLPGEGFRIGTDGTVDGQPATIERSFDLEEAELTTRYVLGDEDDPERFVEAHLRLTGIYTFEDDGDGRMDLSDRIVDHRRVDPDGAGFVSPVREPSPLSSLRAVVPLEDDGQVEITLTTTSDDTAVEGRPLSATESRLNLTAVDLSLPEDRHVAFALEADAETVSHDGEGPLTLAGHGAALSLERFGSGMLAGEGQAATVLEHDTGTDEQALVLLASPERLVNAHEIQTSVVHTSSGLAGVSDAIRGQPGAYLLGLLAATVLVGTAAWRKLEADR